WSEATELHCSRALLPLGWIRASLRQIGTDLFLCFPRVPASRARLAPRLASTLGYLVVAPTALGARGGDIVLVDQVFGCLSSAWLHNKQSAISSQGRKAAISN